MDRFDTIASRNELADYLGIKRSTLTYILYIKKVDNLYYSFTIPKKNGEARPIHAPNDALKIIQNKLTVALYGHQKVIQSEYINLKNLSHAFEKNKSIFTNSKIHRNKRFVINLDLEDYFECFHFGRVKGFFEKNNGYLLPSEVAVVIAQLACYQGSLPQGAPSSPIITNIISQILDNRLLRIAQKYKLDYTRYADDLTFSTNNHHFLSMFESFIADINNEIVRAGFKINDRKTRLQYKDSQQKVTGLVVNKKINVDRNYQRTTKAMAYSLYTKGSFTINNITGNINQLEGRFSFIHQVDEYNRKIAQSYPVGRMSQRSGQLFRSLNGRDEQYRRFLFYKYFVANEKPTIITEGKTDPTYIKAALKSLYVEYPKLVTENKGEFRFQISFLQRSERLSHFFGLFQDGAAPMYNIYCFFNDKDNLPNYSSYFNSIGSNAERNPVILLFDNEQIVVNKPLKGFIKFANISVLNVRILSSNLQLKLIDNLYLMTTPLIGAKPESEIEDLFDHSTLSTIINNKSFSRESDYDTSKYYGKEIFSKFISHNYNIINFSGFRPILDKIVEIMESNK
jgi:RNA-directed DNA polymerase